MAFKGGGRVTGTPGPPPRYAPARADQYGKQVFSCTNTANRFPTVQISLRICTVIWTVFAAVG